VSRSDFYNLDKHFAITIRDLRCALPKCRPFEKHYAFWPAIVPEVEGRASVLSVFGTVWLPKLDRLG